MKSSQSVFNTVAFCVLLLFVLFPNPFGRAAISVQADPGLLYVAPDGNCGGVVSPCHASIQAAINAAVTGDEIRVAAGDYYIVIGADQAFLVDKNLTIRGGYNTSDWGIYAPGSNIASVNALGQGRVAYINSGVNATIAGLTITNGNSDGLGNGCGGGIFADGATLTLRDIILSANAAPSDEMGGGLYFANGTLLVESSTIVENVAGSGAGLRLLSSTATIADSEIIDNETSGGPSTYGGGGVLVGGVSQVTMSGNQILRNTTSFTVSGGGISLQDRTGTYDGTMDLYLDDNLIEDNYSGGGGGVHIHDGYANNLFITATIIDNTIQLNRTYGNGAGIYVSNANVTIRDNTIMTNNAGRNEAGTMREYGDGGGMYISGEATIERNLISDNVAEAIAGEGTGGGAYLDGSDPILFRNNQVISNLAYGVLGGRGGGIYVTGDQVQIESNLIQRNSADGGDDFTGGGGMHISKGDVTLTNNIITDNSVSSDVNFGSGITISGCNPLLEHNTIANNTGGGGHGVYVTDDGDAGQPTFINTIIAFQTVGVSVDAGLAANLTYLDGILWHGNTIDSNGTVYIQHSTTGDPLFIDAGGYDYHIGDGSSAIDKGISYTVLKDYDNEPRFDIPDLGADEYWAAGVLKYLFLPLILH